MSFAKFGFSNFFRCGCEKLMSRGYICIAYLPNQRPGLVRLGRACLTHREGQTTKNTTSRISTFSSTTAQVLRGSRLNNSQNGES